MDQDVKQAIRVLNDGGIVVFPTDTAFGIGCRIDDEQAIKRLFEIRKRPENQAAPVLVDSVEMAQKYFLPIPKDVIDKLIKPYWPGALTIILPCKADKTPILVRGGRTTLGIRVPNHSTIRQIIKGVGVPILGPSANFHGDKTPFSLSEVNKKLQEQVDFIVGGVCKHKQPSTVIDCSKHPWRIIREGAIEPKL